MRDRKSQGSGGCGQGANRGPWVPLCLDSINITEDQEEIFQGRYLYLVTCIFNTF